MADGIIAEAYRRDGFVHLRGVFTAEEVAELRAEADRLLALPLCKPDNSRTPFRFDSGNAPEKLDPVLDISPVFTRAASDPRVTARVAEALGDTPLLFKDKLILKAPGTAGYEPHQDQQWWQLCDPQAILSVSIALDAADATNGGLELLPGAHGRLMAPLGEFRNWTPEEEREWWPAFQGVVPSMQPGDALIFHALAPHRSGRNESGNRPRRSLYLTYNSAARGDLREKQRQAYLARLASPEFAGTKHAGGSYFE